MLGHQLLDPLAVDLSLDQRIVDAAPASLKAGSQTQVRRREHGTSGEGIGEIEERVSWPCKEEVNRRFRNVVSGSKEEVVMPSVSHIGLVLSDSVCSVDLAG
jgi:hypothetical protein